MFRCKFSFSATVCCLVCLTFVGCDNEYSFDSVPNLTDTSGTNAKVLGTCFMEGESCLTTYIDLGPYEDQVEQPPSVKADRTPEKTAVPVYVFPSVPAVDGGPRHPFDPLGLYNPFRLQNNVFAGEGRIWGIYLVYSAELNLMASPEPGTTMWGVGATPEGERTRDLFFDPIKSEAEILALAKAGELRVEDTGRATDCPITPAKQGDIVVNLNPRFSLCRH